MKPDASIVTPSFSPEASEAGILQPPSARRQPVEHLLHGDRRTDDYAAGHGGAPGRYDYLREVALDYAFLLTQLGICQ